MESIDVIEEIGRVPRTDGPVVQSIPQAKTAQSAARHSGLAFREDADKPVRKVFLTILIHLKPLYKTIPVANESLNSSYYF